MAVATDIMNVYGVDTFIGKVASTIMGSTETTLYTIAIYTGVVKIKKTRFVLAAALLGDIVRNACICRNLALYVVKFLLTFLGKCCTINSFIRRSFLEIKIILNILLFFTVYFTVRQVLAKFLAKRILKKISG